MTAQGITRERDRWAAAERSTIGIDAIPLTGAWVNFDPEVIGIVRVDATVHDGCLLLRIVETDDTGPRETGTLAATALASAVDSDQAVGFLANGELGPPSAPREFILCAYLNRGLLTIAVHVIHRIDPTRVNVMYRAHFYRTDGPGRP